MSAARCCVSAAGAHSGAQNNTQHNNTHNSSSSSSTATTQQRSKNVQNAARLLMFALRYVMSYIESTFIIEYRLQMGGGSSRNTTRNGVYPASAPDGISSADGGLASQTQSAQELEVRILYSLSFDSFCMVTIPFTLSNH